jgi:hypothetical protein
LTGGACANTISPFNHTQQKIKGTHEWVMSGVFAVPLLLLLILPATTGRRYL